MALGMDIHTCTYTHTRLHEGDFKKPGTRQPVAGVHLVLNPLFIAIFTKACRLTVLLECSNFCIDLVLQVPGFYSIVNTNLLASKEFLDTVN